MYIHSIYYVYTMYILCIYYVYTMYILCIYYVYTMYILCIYYVYTMYILYEWEYIWINILLLTTIHYYILLYQWKKATGNSDTTLRDSKVGIETPSDDFPSKIGDFPLPEDSLGLKIVGCLRNARIFCWHCSFDQTNADWSNENDNLNKSRIVRQWSIRYALRLPA